jgi:epoxyqueuosine reductase QueG
MTGEKIKEIAGNMGSDITGIGNVSLMDTAPSGFKPTDHVPEAKSIVGIIVRINQAAVEGLPKSRYAYVGANDAAGMRLNKIIYDLANILEDEGYYSLPVFEGENSTTLKGDISLKHAAVICGLGEFGLNNLFLSPQYGPRVLIGAVFTEAELEPDKPFRDELCNLCNACIEACPSGALDNSPQSYDRTNGWGIDKHRCNHYINEILFPVYGHFSCGMCVKACPVGKLH